MILLRSKYDGGRGRGTGEGNHIPFKPHGRGGEQVLGEIIFPSNLMAGEEGRY